MNNFVVFLASMMFKNIIEAKNSQCKCPFNMSFLFTIEKKRKTCIERNSFGSCWGFYKIIRQIRIISPIFTLFHFELDFEKIIRPLLNMLPDLVVLGPIGSETMP